MFSNTWFIVLFVIIGLSVGINILAFVLEKLYKKKMNNMKDEK